MNRIYKVVRRALSGEAVVVSELAKSRVKGGGSQKAESIATDTVRRGILFKTGVALLMAACGSTVLAQQQVYDDSGTVSLETAGSVGSGLPVWTGIPAADQGLVYRSGGSTVVTGADLVIDYSTGTSAEVCDRRFCERRERSDAEHGSPETGWRFGFCIWRVVTSNRHHGGCGSIWQSGCCAG